MNKVIPHYITLIKFIALFIFVFFSNPIFLERITDIGVQLGLLVYLTIWLLSLCAIIALAFSPFNYLKLCIVLLIAISSASSLSYYQITRQYMELFELEVLLNATENFQDSLTTFPSILLAILLSILGVIGFLLPNIKTKLSLRYKEYLIPISITLALMVAILIFREGEGTKGMPSQFTPIAYSLILLTEKTVQGGQIINTVSISPKISDTGDIIFIMDESMTGDFYDINSNNGISTGINKYNPINFGIASSFANCSITTNVSMRYGISRQDYLADLNNKPSIWQFAKRAGYHTIYLDTQNGQGNLTNNMTDTESIFIDDFIHISDKNTELYRKDIAAAHILSKHLNNNIKDFIYLNKTGAHFPYEGKYPKDKNVFQPTMASTAFNRSYGNLDEVEYPIHGDALTRLKFINSYKNTLLWNVSSFFSELFKVHIEQPYTLIYTSDHGQAFHTGLKKGYGTHCSIKDAAPEEGRVPLVLFSNISHIHKKLQQAAKLNFNKVSQFNLPATLYNLMGYNKQDLEDRYQKSIYSPLDSSNQIFLSKYFVRFGAKPIWNSIHKAPTQLTKTESNNNSTSKPWLTNNKKAAN